MCWIIAEANGASTIATLSKTKSQNKMTPDDIVKAERLAQLCMDSEYINCD